MIMTALKGQVLPQSPRHFSEQCLKMMICECRFFLQTVDDNLYGKSDINSLFALFKSGGVQPLPICEDGLQPECDCGRRCGADRYR